MEETLPIPDEQQEGMDALFGQAVNQETVDDIKKDSQLPEGNYVRTEDPATVTVQKHKVTGRSTFVVFAPIQAQKDEKVKGRVRFRVSWERQNKIVRDEATGEETDTGKPDIQSRLYANVVDAYKRVNGEAPANLGQLAQYLANAPYKLRLMNGDDSEVVLNLYATK